MNDMQLLECYRATLLQWPPNFYMTNSSVFSIPRRTLRAQPDSKQFDAFGTIRALLTPSGPPVKLYQRSDTIHSLTALLLLTSHAALTQSTASEPVHIWDKRFFELGLHSWLRWQQAPPEASTLMLFHMGFIVLHTNMASLHSVVREFCIGKSPPPVTMSAIRRWRESDGCGIALEHAAQLLELSTSRPGRPAQATPSARSGSEENKGEAPHVAICVYLAVVTRWVAEISRPVPDLNAARAVLARGLVILQRLNLLIANGFANMLRRLEENCS
ncbi:hypothetical protein BKA56DRAFT_190924 [Ilyonectria sp. MPI-CAGE-AT-0026]|nr:hypothetical protein BKA56DRAFT_190924 [Ilyonectria sp. MPI-CAGE-AT-0026]